jgi:hypothetical protein
MASLAEAGNIVALVDSRLRFTVLFILIRTCKQSSTVQYSWMLKASKILVSLASSPSSTLASPLQGGR